MQLIKKLTRKLYHKRWLIGLWVVVGVLLSIQLYVISELYESKDMNSRALVTLKQSIDKYQMQYARNLKEKYTWITQEALDMALVEGGISGFQKNKYAQLLYFPNNLSYIAKKPMKNDNTWVCKEESEDLLNYVFYEGYYQKNTPIFDRVDLVLLRNTIQEEFEKAEFSSVHWGLLDYQTSQLYLNEELREVENLVFDAAQISKEQLSMLDLALDPFYNRVCGIFLHHEDDFWIKKEFILFLLLSLISVLCMTFLFYFNLFAQSKILELAHLKYNFINNLTHELNTPVAALLMAAEASSYKEIDPSAQKYLKIMRKESTELQGLINKLLQSVMLHGGLIQLSIQPVDLLELVQRVVHRMHHLLEAKGANLQIEADPSIDFCAAIDPEHFQHVIYQLIDNAIKYSKDRVDIKIRLIKDKKCIVFQVQDQGIGIAPQNLRRVFHRLYRAYEKDIHDVRGYGLGLSYVRDMVYLHKGQLYIDSKVGQGTTISVKIQAYE